jgi:arylsulfatase A
VRDGDWMFVQYYDDDAADELYNLAADIEEKNNLAAKHPERVATLRRALADWRQAMNAQSNRPNPEFDPARYRALYQDFNSSRFDPARASEAEWAAVQEWRKGMNSAVQGAKAAKKAREEPGKKK